MMADNMDEQQLAQTDREILNRLAEYCKYLYEEEKERTERLERKVNVFAVALGGSFVAVFLKLPVGKMPSILDVTQLQGFIVTILFSISLLLFFLSSFFTFLVYKVREFERLSDPKKMALKTQSMTHEVDILSAMIADYTVATNLNHKINEDKARHLSFALLCLLGALFLVVITLILINTVIAWNGVG